MCAALPFDILLLDQPKIRFIYQGRSLQSMAEPLAADVLMSQPMQFVVNQRRQSGERFFLATPPLPQQFSYFMLRSRHDFTWVSG